jgi:hypothetical protein
LGWVDTIIYVSFNVGCVGNPSNPTKKTLRFGWVDTRIYVGFYVGNADYVFGLLIYLVV